MLHYSGTGTKRSKTAIVFLHGGGFSGWMWENIIGHLPDYFCLAITLPGHGLSAKEEWVSIEDTARQVGEIIDNELEGMDVHIVGLSLGGHVALQLLSDRPKDISSATLSCIIHDPLPNAEIYHLLLRGILKFRKIPMAQKFVAHKFGMAGEKTRRYLQEVRKVDKKAIKQSSAEIANLKLPPNLQEVSSRVLLLAGETERSFTLDALPKYKSEFSNYRSAIVPKYGYGWSGKCPSLFADAIRAQISQNQLPAELIEQN